MIPQWNSCARVGVNLDPSPFHARNVYLVLNPHTGLVSPQFYVSFDDFFETVHMQKEPPTISTWKSLAGFKSAKTSMQASMVNSTESSPTHETKNQVLPSVSDSTPTDTQDCIFDAGQSVMHKSEPVNDQNQDTLHPTQPPQNNRVQNLLDQVTNM